MLHVQYFIRYTKSCSRFIAWLKYGWNPKSPVLWARFDVTKRKKQEEKVKEELVSSQMKQMPNRIRSMCDAINSEMDKNLIIHHHKRHEPTNESDKFQLQRNKELFNIIIKIMRMFIVHVKTFNSSAIISLDHCKCCAVVKIFCIFICTSSIYYIQRLVCLCLVWSEYTMKYHVKTENWRLSTDLLLQ